jgi:hypothetical protein
MAELVGSYVDDMAEVLVGSVVSGHHACLIGARGYGKTDLERFLMRKIVGNDDLFFTLEATTPADYVNGPIDMKKILADDAEVVRILTKSIYAPNAFLIGLDEYFRAMDAVQESGLQALARKDIPRSEQPTFWVTSNFAPKTERLLPVLDRITLWYWIEKFRLPKELLKDMVYQHASNGGEVVYNGKVSIPTIEQIKEVRAMTPSNRAIAAISDVCYALEEEAFTSNSQEWDVNPRRISQWSRLLSTVSMYHYGAEDFSSVHQDAVKMLQYAYPSKTQDEANKWKEIAGAVVDVIGTAIASIKADAYASFRQIKQQNNSLSARVTMAVKLTEEMGKRQREFTEICGDDPRVQDAIQELSRIHAAIVRGENPVELEG